MDPYDMPRHRPLAFDKMEVLIKEMQDPETGVPVRSQKLFLSVIPSAFMGYDLVEWLMDRFNLDETSNVEAINLANQLCQYGYFFPVNDLKNLVLKDDSSLYRFQSPYYWPWQTTRVAGSSSSAPSLGPDNIEYAIYLVKRTLRNKQRHALEDYEQEALANLKKNLAAKWDFITMQAEEQVRLAKDRKKGDKIVSDSQERAYWRVARPPPGSPSALEPCPVPVRVRTPRRKRTVEQLSKEIEILRTSLDRTRVKTSIALEALLAYSETFAPYDPWLTPPQPSNPWITDDTLFWQINSPLVEVPSEKRVQRWALSIEELVNDPTGLQEFTSFLRKEYSHENIRFWLAVMDLRRSSTKQIPVKLKEIYEEFLKPGAPCEINIDGATAEKVAEGLRTGSRYALDHAADHVYGLLLKKDCYPRFVRSDHFQRLLAEGKNVHQKKAKFFNFGGGQVKKKPGGSQGGTGAVLSRRRGSDRSLSGSAHELAVCSAQPPRHIPDQPSHSHSQSNLADIPFRDPLEDVADEALPWESGSGSTASGARRRQDSCADSGSSSSDVSCVPERRRLPQQSTLDGGLRGAPPPLRRLSAVEPRHLAPLASPPHTPRPRPALPAAAPPHPTPTISVSSAPEDDSPGASSPDRRSPAPSEEPSSVFASADATPTEPTRPLPERAPSLEKTVSSPSCDSRTDVKEVSVRRERSVAGPSRASSTTTRELSPASSMDSSRVTELPTRSDSPRTATPSTAPVTPAPTPPPPSDPAPARALSLPDAVSLVPVVSPAPTASPASEAEKVAEASQPVEEPAAAVTPAPALEPAPSELPAAGTAGDSRRPVAPLAEGEDTGVEDEQADKVPSAPNARPVVQSAAAAGPVARLATETGPAAKPAIEAGPASSRPVYEAGPATVTDAAAVAPKDEPSTVPRDDVVKRDNKSELAERKQRNDVCPWEDENSCESDAPFVKTYATLGYL